MGAVIRATGLSKKYLVSRQEAYGTLRDSIARAVGSLWRGRSAEPSVQEHWALNDVSFSVEQGDIVGVIGRNGSGKSTLLKILSRITEPTSGRAEVRGQVASLLEVGTGFHPELTGRENIFVNGAILGMKRRDILKKFDEIVAFADVGPFIDTPVKRYSSGMQMRLAFAVAAHLDPEILLVDEVLAVGDAQFQRKCLNTMAETARSGRTVLFVSHQMNQIRKLCTTGLWLDRGRVALCGPAPQVISAYEEQFGGRSSTEAARAGTDPQTTQFISWSRTGVDGEYANTVPDGDAPLSVTFVLHVTRRIERGHHGIALFNNDNLLIWAHAFDDLVLEPGLVELTYEFPALPLRPGVYHWDVSLYDDGRLLDRWSAVPAMRMHGEMRTHASDQWQGVLNLKFAMQLRRGTLPHEAGTPQASHAVI